MSKNGLQSRPFLWMILDWLVRAIISSGDQNYEPDSVQYSKPCWLDVHKKGRQERKGISTFLLFFLTSQASLFFCPKSDRNLCPSEEADIFLHFELLFIARRYGWRSWRCFLPSTFTLSRENFLLAPRSRRSTSIAWMNCPKTGGQECRECFNNPLIRRASEFSQAFLQDSLFLKTFLSRKRQGKKCV